MKIKSKIFRCCALLMASIMTTCTFTEFAVSTKATTTEEQSPYTFSPVEGGIEVINGTSSYDRALFGTHVNDLATSPIEGYSMQTYVGQKPRLALSHQKLTHVPGDNARKMANVFFGIKDGIWLENAETIKAQYVYGREEYTITDPSFNGEIKLTFIMANDYDGVMVKVQIPDELKGKMFFAVGGNSQSTDGYTNQAFQQSATLNTSYNIGKNSFELTTTNDTIKPLYGFSSVDVDLSIKDSLKYSSSISDLLNSTGSANPMLVGEVSDNNATEWYYMFGMQNTDIKEVSDYVKNPEECFNESIDYFKEICEKMVIETPDDYLDSTMYMACAGVDAWWHEPYVMHGPTTWHIPYAGWRSRYAFSDLGYGDRVFQDALEYKKFQGEDGRIHATPDDLEGDSYNMDEVFVDQLLYNWEATGDTEYMRDYGYDMIKKHLQAKENTIYVDEYKLYENFLNSWNTDNKFTNGGAGSIASAYMWSAYTKMSELANELGYNEDSVTFSKKADEIKSAMREHLWDADQGVYAEYKDSLGEKQLHTAPDLSTVYTTIDEDVMDMFDKYTSLKFTENNIERVTGLPRGGETVYSSNWLPDYYSTRGIYAKEMMHLLLVYYQTGQSDKADKILKGNQNTIFTAHGNFNYPIYTRSIYEGLFGIKLYTNKEKIVVKPSFPSDWKTAKINSHYINYDYNYDGTTERINISSLNNNECEVKLKAKTPHVTSVTVNGKPIEYTIEEGVDVSYIAVTTPKGTAHDVVVNYKTGELPSLVADEIGAKGMPYKISVENGTIEKIYDPQSIVKSSAINNSECETVLADKTGYHTFFVLVKNGDFKIWLPVDIEIKEPLEIVDEKISYEGEKAYIEYSIQNNTQQAITFNSDSNIRGINSESENTTVEKLSKHEMAKIEIPYINYLSVGSNLLTVNLDGDYTGKISKDVVDWNINSQTVNIMDGYKHVETINLDGYVNQALKDLHTNKYNVLPKFYWSVIPRTVQSNGRSYWSDRKAPVSTIDNMNILDNQNILTDNGIPFRISNVDGKNSVFTSQYENFHESVTIDINKKASKLYFMLAVSTNPNQSRIENAYINVNFADGTSKKLSLSDPQNIDDWLGFQKGEPAYSLTGYVQKLSDEAHANVLDFNLGEEKEIKNIEFKCLSNEVLAGLLGVTLVSSGTDESLQQADELIENSEKTSEIFSQEKLANLIAKRDELLNAEPNEQEEKTNNLYTAIKEYLNSSTVNITVSPEETELTQGTKINISTNNPSVVIRYTLDGSEPSSSSPMYTMPIKLPVGDTNLKIAAFYNGILAADLINKTYTVKAYEFPDLASSNTGAEAFVGGGSGGGGETLMNDGNYGTKGFCNGGSDLYFGIDLKTEQSFNKVVLSVPPTVNQKGPRISAGKLQISDDGQSWTDIPDQTPLNTTSLGSIGGKPSYVSTITFPTVTAKYVRIYVTKATNAQLSEFEVYNYIPTDYDTGLKLGDYIQMGKYNDTPIMWRVVDIDEQNGPLLLSDKILCMKSFDGAGTNGSHSDNTIRQKEGSDVWADSNIRSWLMSSADAGKVEWLCQNPPTKESVSSKNGVAYDNEKGFLHKDNFTATEVGLMKSVSQKSILLKDVDSKIDGYVDGTANFPIPKSWDNFTSGYDTAPYHMVTDKIFLPDVVQMKKVYDNSYLLGDNYAVGYDINGNKQFTWLRTRQGPYASGTMVINSAISQTNATYGNGSWNGNAGVRPAFYLDTDIVNIVDGTGQKDTPYTLSSYEQWSINNITKTDNEVTVSLSQISNQTGVVILGVYNAEDNTLLSLMSESVVSGKNDYIFEVEQADNIEVKAFIFSDMENITPLCKSMVKQF